MNVFQPRHSLPASATRYLTALGAGAISSDMALSVIMPRVGLALTCFFFFLLQSLPLASAHGDGGRGRPYGSIPEQLFSRVNRDILAR